MHGDLDARDSIVLTEEDYRCYEQSRPGVALKVKQLLLEHPSMFVGFSLRDPNVAAIEGWIRDTTGRLKLPSIVLVHDEPLDAERDMWAQRGIQLIYIRPSDKLERFFDAIHGERSPIVTHNDDARHESARSQALRKLLQTQPVNWEAQVAQLLVQFAEFANDSEYSDAAHHVLLGGFHNLRFESIKAVLDKLGTATRRLVLLRAHKCGIVAIAGSDRASLDIEEELLADSSLTPEEKASVLLRRAKRYEIVDNLQEAKQRLIEARELSTSATAHEHIQRQLRRVLLRIGDDADIASELLDAPLREDAFAYARRGSDALMTRGRGSALRWYEEALNAARTGDEKTAALSGMEASCDPSDWSRLVELDEIRMAILPSERPRVEKVRDLEHQAGNKLLKSFREGVKKSSAELAHAIENLREALAEADDMGWPKCAGPNYTTRADGIAYAIVGLSLSDDATIEQVKGGFALIVERGLMSLERYVGSPLLDRVLANAELEEWTRQLILPRREAAYMTRSRSLLRSAMLPILSDADICTHVVDALTFEDLKQNRLARETTRTELHLRLLSGYFRYVPGAAAKHIFRICCVDSG